MVTGGHSPQSRLVGAKRSKDQGTGCLVGLTEGLTAPPQRTSPVANICGPRVGIQEDFPEEGSCLSCVLKEE